jgi:hypothetical protein
VVEDKYAYLDDTPESIYKELKDLETSLLDASQGVRDKGRQAVNAKAVYDAAKHTELVHLYADEADTPGLKRTELQRAVLYRTKHATERLAWVLADREYEVARDYVKSLQAVLMSIQTRSRLLRKDFD